MTDRGSLADRLIGGIGEGEDPRAAQFVRGLALGALVGAAIAGSTIWQRRRATGRSMRAVAAGRPQSSAASLPGEQLEPTDQGDAGR